MEVGGIQSMWIYFIKVLGESSLFTLFYWSVFYSKSFKIIFLGAISSGWFFKYLPNRCITYLQKEGKLSDSSLVAFPSIPRYSRYTISLFCYLIKSASMEHMLMQPRDTTGLGWSSQIFYSLRKLDLTWELIHVMDIKNFNPNPHV